MAIALISSDGTLALQASLSNLARSPSPSSAAPIKLLGKAAVVKWPALHFIHAANPLKLLGAVNSIVSKPLRAIARRKPATKA